MDAAFSRDDLQFRDEVRAFLDERLTPDLRRAGRSLTSVYAGRETMRQWQSILHEKGWVAPAWPVEHGGCGWPAVRRAIFQSELAAADAPPLSPMGLSMCGPVIIGHGNAEQKAFYLPRILSGEDFWCQGYSEPGAGSDLAALQMSAEDSGDHWVCNGRKIWTTHGMLANRIFCLVRTSRDGPPQRGITFLLIDMATPGIEVRPITMLTGEQIQCEIHFRDVAVPKANAVGRPTTAGRSPNTCSSSSAADRPPRLHCVRACAGRGRLPPPAASAAILRSHASSPKRRSRSRRWSTPSIA